MAERYLDHPGQPAGDDESVLDDEPIESNDDSSRKDVVRLIAFASSVLSTLSAGGISAFSLYGPLLLTRLHYTQFRVNVIAVTAEMVMYLTAPMFGYLCDRVRPSVVSFISAILFGLGYVLAAFTYSSGPPPDSTIGGSGGRHGWPFGVMVFAFAILGSAMGCMYFSAVTTSAKNYATSKHKGIMLSVPIAAFGLSGMWHSLLVKFFVYQGTDSTAYKDGTGVDIVHGDVNVFKFFIFLAIITFSVGIIGTFLLNVVDEDKLIEAGAEELERSGLLTEGDGQYGTLQTRNSDGDVRGHDEAKKEWLLNQETKLFLNDKTMWLLALGFILISGPGEAYMNNVGTLISTLTPASSPPAISPPAGLPSTHVGLVALTSTLARLITGSLSDYFAPTLTKKDTKRVSFSRLLFLIPSGLLVALGYLFLASPLLVTLPPLLHLTTALVGFGYGACFSLVPIIISVVWGVENFGTNWAIVSMVQAPGAGVSGIIYSAEYDAGVGSGGQCFGWKCFGYWAIGSVLSGCFAVTLWTLAWRGWKRRSVIV